MLPEPLQSLLTFLLASVGQQPERRLRDPPEREEEEEAEERRDSCHDPPVEESPQAVAGQHPHTNHQAEQRQEPSPSLEGAGEMNMSGVTLSISMYLYSATRRGQLEVMHSALRPQRIRPRMRVER